MSSQIPEARGLKWEDTFFRDEDGHIATFDFDYDKIVAFQSEVACVSMLFPPILVFGTLFCYPCLFRQQIKWNTYSQHVCITQDGIKFVQDRRKTGCGLGCQDAGKTSKTVPFDKITDCDVTEPAGATCCCIDNVLPVVNVDTASGGRTGGEGGPLHELTLVGLKDPLKFKKLVWAMKRANAEQRQAVPLAGYDAPAPAAAKMQRGGDGGGGGGGDGETNAILRDIRSELVELNKNIKVLQDK